MTDFIDIQTERLVLTPFAERHLTPEYVGWLNDKALMRYSMQRHREHTIDSSREYWQSFSGSPHYFLAIEERTRERLHIGNLNAYMDAINGTADIGVLVGESGSQNKGYATEALEALIDYLLYTVGCRKVAMGTIAPNEPMLCVMRKLGMEGDGVRRKQQRYEGKEVDVIHMALFRLKKIHS